MSEKFNNKVIEVLDVDHGQKVKAYLQSKGVDVIKHQFTLTKERDCFCRYYGVIDDRFNCYSKYDVDRTNSKIITLPEEPEKSTYPKVMWVSDTKLIWVKRVVFAEKCGRYLAWATATTLEGAENMWKVHDWVYAKNIEPELNLPKYKVLTDLPLYNIPKGTEIYLAGLQLSTMTQNSPFMWNNEIIRIPNQLVKLVSDGCI